MAAAKCIEAGQRFGSWTVLESVETQSSGVFCRCACTREMLVAGPSLVKGLSTKCRSCASKKHGLYQTSGYDSWKQMVRRCTVPGSKDYVRYGGSGITVDERWLGLDGLSNFIEDMGERPTRKHSIDRVDNTKGYSRDNCRWATSTEQSRNRSNSRLLTFEGLTLTQAEWADRQGLDDDTIIARLRRGWSVEEALTLPLYTKIKERVDA